LNPITAQRRNIITPGVWLQTKEITEQGDRRGDSKEDFTEMDKYRQMKDTIWSQVIQDPKILEKTMEKKDARRQRPAQMKERNKTISPGLRAGTRS
jgi:hypothetical protein